MSIWKKLKKYTKKIGQSDPEEVEKTIDLKKQLREKKLQAKLAKLDVVTAKAQLKAAKTMKKAKKHG
jgi:hypothetical protein